MRQARILFPEGGDPVVSRVVERRMAFGDEEKRYFVKLMKACAGFSVIPEVALCVP